jgi:hypothetical protein
MGSMHAAILGIQIKGANCIIAEFVKKEFMKPKRRTARCVASA